MKTAVDVSTDIGTVRRPPRTKLPLHRQQIRDDLFHPGHPLLIGGGARQTEGFGAGSGGASLRRPRGIQTRFPVQGAMVFPKFRSGTPLCGACGVRHTESFSLVSRLPSVSCFCGECRPGFRSEKPRSRQTIAPVACLKTYPTRPGIHRLRTNPPRQTEARLKLPSTGEINPNVSANDLTVFRVASTCSCTSLRTWPK
jgi:hypothetical protein